MKATEYPSLETMSTRELFLLLKAYDEESQYMRDCDAAFIAAIQKEMKSRRDVAER